MRIEHVVARVVDDGAHGVGETDAQDRRGGRALAEAAEQRPVEVERFDHRTHVVGEHRERRRAVTGNGRTGTTRVERDHPEVLGERLHVTDVPGGVAAPDRPGGREAAVQEHEWLARTRFDVVDVEVVGTHVRAASLSGLGPDGHGALLGSVAPQRAGREARGHEGITPSLSGPGTNPSSGSSPCCIAKRLAVARFDAPIFV